MARLPETKQALSTFNVPTTVKDAEHLMQDELGMKEKMMNLFAESELKMDQFMTSLKEQQKHTDSIMVHQQYIMHIALDIFRKMTKIFILDHIPNEQTNLQSTLIPTTTQTNRQTNKYGTSEYTALRTGVVYIL